MVKKTKGRRKVEMVPIEDKSHRWVTYSKRRTGLFKKASELVILCGAETAIIVFSPGGKAYSYGHPSVERVLERYLANGIPVRTSAMRLLQAHQNVVCKELNMQLNQVVNELERQKRYGAELDRIRKERERQSQNWWEMPVETMNLAQLEQLKASLLHLRLATHAQADRIEILAAQRNLQAFPELGVQPAPNPAPAFQAPPNPFQQAPMNYWPPAPNPNDPGAFDPRFGLPNQPAAWMVNNQVFYGHNPGFGNNVHNPGFGNNGPF